MDRFKFRVWNKGDETYEETTSFDCIRIDNDGQLRISNYSDASERLEDYTDSYIIEQCTGLKDKNGNLIYEGDVVLGSSGFNYKIIWSDMECGWALQNLESKVCIAMNAFTADEIEIIGNIHEQKDNK